MSRSLTLILLSMLLTGSRVTATDEKARIYYVQLIRGCDEEKPPEPGSHRVGPKLAQRFQCLFGCRSYWEISQEKVELSPGRIARVRLRNDRSVEIDLTQPGKRQISAYCKGHLVDRTVEPTGEHMTLIGGDRDKTSHWFVVVRRDKPGP